MSNRDWPRLKCVECDAPLDSSEPEQCAQCGVSFKTTDGVRSFIRQTEPLAADTFSSDLYQELYKKECKEYYLYWGRRQLLYRLLEPVLARKPAQKALDIGCGTGYVLDGLSALGLDVAGIEADPVPLRLALARGLPHVYEAVAEKLPFQSDQFDLVVSLDVYEHIDDDVKAIREAKRVLVPGGKHVIFVPANRALWSSCDTMQGHKRRYDKTELGTKLSEAGFVVDRMTYLLPTFFIPALLIRRLNRMLLSEEKGKKTAFLEYSMPPKWLNSILKSVMQIESRLLARMNFPFGITLAALATNPDHP
ncbi:MAG: class I SAM-dependent methyltransferase [Candidatus Hydrogenedentes bacterium]|nr:class I SAM-dependent methyltransferase [Candidatus Hydrogenedentota bacterium]